MLGSQVNAECQPAARVALESLLGAFLDGYQEYSLARGFGFARVAR